MLNQPIFLVGFMGSGKTTWGKRLAHKFAIPFIDTDTWIQEKEGRSISDIFEQHGETYFREKERDLIQELSQKPYIIATGGGMPCYFDNMKKLNQIGRTVYLRLPEKALFQRLQQERGKRPLIAHLDDEALLTFIRQKLQERDPIYLQSKVVVQVLKADVNSLAQHLHDLDTIN